MIENKEFLKFIKKKYRKCIKKICKTRLHVNENVNNIIVMRIRKKIIKTKQ